MTADAPTEADKLANKHLLQALVAIAAYCGISLLSFSIPLALPLMVLSGIGLPLVWGRVTGTWEFMGFTRKKIASAVRWGLAAGVATSLIGLVMVKERSIPHNLAQELAVGIPLWLLVASPFQEFFFRGWLQPRFEHRLGPAMGLLVATVAFTAWHYCWPLAAQSAVPLYTVHGFVATFAAGLIYGYSFQRTGNIVAPWLAHALSGILFVFLGVGSVFGQLP